MAPTTAAAAQGPLALRAFVDQVRSSNRAIKSRQAERDITATGVDRAAAALQPVLSAATQRRRNRQANTREADLIPQKRGNYPRSGTD